MQKRIRVAGGTVMNQDQRHALFHVLWIGGATDTGKTTIAQILARRRGFQVYDYDRHDLPHIKRLARTNADYRAFLTAPMEEKWVQCEPEDLLRFMLQAFRDRFPLVIEDLLSLPAGAMVVAEGHGLTPELVTPVLSSKHQAVWLIPTAAFKRASMQRRNKPSFRDEVSDPERATHNVFTRDMLLAEQVKAQAQARGLSVFEVDGSRSPEEMATLVEQHFKPFLQAS